MVFNLLAKLYLTTLLYNGAASWYPGIGVESFSIHEELEKEVENGAVKDTMNISCDSQSLSSVPACSSPWTYCGNGTCKCADTEEILCLPSGQALVLTGYCVTFDEAQALTQLGLCVYKYVLDKHVIWLQYNSLSSNVSELSDVMCGPFNRTGMLCGKCKDGYYPLVNSLDVNCVQCPNGWSNLWKQVMVIFLRLTVFYFIILLFRINATPWLYLVLPRHCFTTTCPFCFVICQTQEWPR